MGATLRSYARRRFEERIRDEIECFDCGQPRGKPCVNRRNRESVICCQARADFAVPRLREMAKMRMLLVGAGLLPIPPSVLEEVTT